MAKPILLPVGTIGYGPAAVKQLIELYSKIPYGGDVQLTFYKCEKLSHIAVAFLAGMRTAARKGRQTSLTFLESSMVETMHEHLAANGLITHQTGKSRRIPIRGDTIYCTRYVNKQTIKKDLETIWLADAWLQADAEVKAALAGQVYELLDNALTHSGINECFVCGHYYSKKNEMHLCIIDFGIGIPNKVRAHWLEQNDVDEDVLNRAPDSVFLRWALQKGNTTMKGESRGLGLGLLEEFIRLNKGCVDIYSLSAQANISESQTYTGLSEGFPGTMLNIVYKTDGLYYFMEPGEEHPI